MNDPESSPPGRPEISRTPLATGLDALGWAVATKRAPEVVEQVRARNRRRRRRRFAALVGSTAALAMAGLFWSASRAGGPELRLPYESAVVSLPARQSLDDGTVVELKTGATIEPRFEPGFRRVILRGGEAHFQVTKDSARPFVVVAEGVEVRAVGTAFAVQISSGVVDILVTEGSVAVDRPPVSTWGTVETNSATASLALVVAGKRVVVETDSGAPVLRSPVAVVSAAEQHERLSWRIPRLEFSGTPLSRAIPLFNEHSRVRLILDPALGKLQLSGTLRANDTDSLLLLLKNEFNIAAENRGDGEILLRREQESRRE